MNSTYSKENKTKIVLLTGSELRHDYFRKEIAKNVKIGVVSSFCEGKEKSLENLIKKDKGSSNLMRRHAEERKKSEEIFFSKTKLSIDSSNPVFIKKGEINNKPIVKKIIEMNPDLIVCYGSSLIKSELLERFKGKFINVHLGLSPYYRGSGTNIWPLINKEPEYIGATFMYIDSGIDTGNIIHQIRAEIKVNDSPHMIGNRLITEMTIVYQKIITNFFNLKLLPQPDRKRGRLYLIKDFDNESCLKLYKNFEGSMIKDYLLCKKDRDINAKIIVNNLT